MFKNAENSHIEQVIKFLFLGHFFQMAGILKPIEMMTRNQLPVTLNFPKFSRGESNFLIPHSILVLFNFKNGLILDIFWHFRRDDSPVYFVLYVVVVYVSILQEFEVLKKQAKVWLWFLREKFQLFYTTMRKASVRIQPIQHFAFKC